MCKCVADKNCILLHFYTSCHLKEKCVQFLLFRSLVRNENIKRPGFYMLQVTKVFSNFPLKQLKQNE